MWTTEALIAIGEDDSMGKAVKKVIECQGKLIEYIVKVRHVNAYKLQSSVGAVLRRNPKLLDIYLDVCKSSGVCNFNVLILGVLGIEFVREPKE